MSISADDALYVFTENIKQTAQSTYVEERKRVLHSSANADTDLWSLRRTGWIINSPIAMASAAVIGDKPGIPARTHCVTREMLVRARARNASLISE